MTSNLWAGERTGLWPKRSACSLIPAPEWYGSPEAVHRSSDSFRTSSVRAPPQKLSRRGFSSRLLHPTSSPSPDEEGSRLGKGTTSHTPPPGSLPQRGIIAGGLGRYSEGRFASQNQARLPFQAPRVHPLSRICGSIDRGGAPDRRFCEAFHPL